MCIFDFGLELLHYAREPISVSRFDTRLVTTSVLTHVNRGPFLTAVEVSAASLQRQHAAHNQGADLAECQSHPLNPTHCPYLSEAPVLSLTPSGPAVGGERTR